VARAIGIPGLLRGSDMEGRHSPCGGDGRTEGVEGGGGGGGEEKDEGGVQIVSRGRPTEG
jgi:hypothetical protein